MFELNDVQFAVQNENLRLDAKNCLQEKKNEEEDSLINLLSKSLE